MKENYSKEIQDLIIPEKSPERVSKFYNGYPKEWAAQYNMLLNDGVTCKNCAHCERCCMLFGQKEEYTSCQFYPNRFNTSPTATIK